MQFFKAVDRFVYLRHKFSASQEQWTLENGVVPGPDSVIGKDASGKELYGVRVLTGIPTGAPNVRVWL
jgi:hypothetical protein